MAGKNQSKFLQMFNYISKTVPARLALSHVVNIIDLYYVLHTYVQEQSETTFRVTIKYSNLIKYNSYTTVSI